MDFAASAGLLTVLEPPLFEALVHNTATQAGTSQTPAAIHSFSPKALNWV